MLGIAFLCGVVVAVVAMWATGSLVGKARAPEVTHRAAIGLLAEVARIFGTGPRDTDKAPGVWLSRTLAAARERQALHESTQRIVEGLHTEGLSKVDRVDAVLRSTRWDEGQR